MNAKLAEKVTAKLSLEGSLSTYRYCDGVWTLNMRDAVFEGPEGVLEAPSIKVVACEAKNKSKKR